MNNRDTLSPDELVKFFLSRQKRADLNKTEEDTPNGLMQEDIIVEPLEDQESEDTLDFLQRMIMSQSGKVAEAKETLGEQLADIKEKALANIDNIKNTQLKSGPNPFIGGPLSPMLTEEGVEQEVEKIVDPMLRDPKILDIPPKLFDESAQQTEEVLTDAEISDIATSAIDAAPDADEVQPTDGKDLEFYLDIGKYAEGDHGDIPSATNDSREADKPIEDRSKDVGYGHKVKEYEEASGFIHGIKFKNEDGTYIPLTEEQKIKILNADMKNELNLARKEGWDAKLKAIGTKWEELDPKYQNALNSLAYNVGGPKAAKQWTVVLFAAKDKNLLNFAKEMRRKDNKKYTAGMDNRVVKELYYAGLISNFSEVSSVLPLATADGAGVPE
tara:strand:- start:44 stop:1201 length:1158 start_codon:yes stop_codon:yes gene_type:complete